MLLVLYTVSPSEARARNPFRLLKLIPSPRKSASIHRMARFSETRLFASIGIDRRSDLPPSSEEERTEEEAKGFVLHLCKGLKKAFSSWDDREENASRGVPEVEEIAEKQGEKRC